MSNPVANFRAVPRPKVYTAIVEQILDNIRSGSFTAGSALPSERLLVEQLGVSRSSLREAIRVLEHAGVLDVRGGSGAYVTADGLSKAAALRARAALVGEHSPLDIIAVRSVMEPLAAELAAECRHEKDLEAMERSLTEHAEALDADADPAAADEAFHLAVASASHNDVVSDIEQYFTDLMHQQLWTDLKQRSRIRDNTGRLFLDHHREIFEAIKDGKAKLAAEQMRAHMSDVKASLLKELAPED